MTNSKRCVIINLMNRYIVQVNIAITAKSEKEAQRIMKQVVESGTAMGSEGTKLAKIVLRENPIIVEKLAF